MIDAAPVQLQHIERVRGMGCSICRIQTLIEELLQQADLQALERLLKSAATVIGHRQLDAGRIARIEARHRPQQQRRILGGLR